MQSIIHGWVVLWRCDKQKGLCGCICFGGFPGYPSYSNIDVPMTSSMLIIILSQRRKTSGTAFIIELIGNPISAYVQTPSSTCAQRPKTLQSCPPSACLAYPIIPREHQQNGHSPCQMLLTSCVYARYPMTAGNATTYAKVMPAVRLVQRKYLCRLTIMSMRGQNAIEQWEGVSLEVLLFHFIIAGSIARAALKESVHWRCIGHRAELTGLVASHGDSIGGGRELTACLVRCARCRR